jgi:hypothetical protein
VFVIDSFDKKRLTEAGAELDLLLEVLHCFSGYIATRLGDKQTCAGAHEHPLPKTLTMHVGGTASTGTAIGFCEQTGPPWGTATERDCGGPEPFRYQGPSMANRRLFCNARQWHRAWNELVGSADFGIVQ